MAACQQATYGAYYRVHFRTKFETPSLGCLGPERPWLMMVSISERPTQRMRFLMPLLMGKNHDFVQNFDADKSKQRVLESMDIFGGEGNFRKCCEKIGVSCKGIDILYDNVMHNFVTETGFFFILAMMLTVVSGTGLESFFGVVGIRYCRSPCVQLAVDCHCVHLRWSLGGYYVGLHVTCMCSCLRPTTADLSISPTGTKPSMQCGERTRSSSTCWLCYA